jgi:hypothetical protein
MSDRISELAGLIAAQVPGLIDEARDQINEAINAAMEDAQEKENGKAILSLAITAKWDLDGNNVTISMPVAVRRKFEVVAALEDPNQGKLVLDADGDPMSASVSKALNKFQETMKQHGATVTIQKGVGL